MFDISKLGQVYMESFNTNHLIDSPLYRFQNEVAMFVMFVMFAMFEDICTLDPFRKITAPVAATNAVIVLLLT